MAFEKTAEVLEQGIARGVAPGMVAGLWTTHDSGWIWLSARGERRKSPSAQPLDVHTVFDLASLTKLCTAVLCARLVDRGWLTWQTPVRAILPRFPGSDAVQIRHLLSHTAGFVAWRPFWETLRDQLGGVEALARTPVHRRQALMRELVWQVAPDCAPGERAEYSDLSFLNLGFALEEVLARPLDRAIHEEVWAPLGMAGCRFFKVDRGVEAGRRDEVAATENCPWRGGVLQGQVHDDNCWAMGGYAGHAGMFGTARDLLLFAGGLAHGQFLSEKTRTQMWARVDQPAGASRTLGWDTPSGDRPAAGKLFSARSVGHLGFTGVSLWLDLDAGVAATLLTNRVHPTRENNLIREFRPEFHEALRRDLGY